MSINNGQFKGQLNKAKNEAMALVCEFRVKNVLEEKGNMQKNFGAAQALVADAKVNTLSRRAARILTLMAVSGSGLMLSMSASAALSPALDRISISAGSFRANPTFDASLNTPYGNLQSQDIKLGMETMPRLKAEIMLFDTQGFSFDYYKFKRGYTNTISTNTNVYGATLTMVGNAKFDINLDFAKLEYRWWFGNENTVVGLGAGAAYYQANVNATVTASINNATTSISGNYDESAVAPLLGIGIRHAISPDLRLFADASGVKQTQGRLNGEMYNATVGVEWFPINNVGVVCDYSMSKLDLTRAQAIDENFKFNLQGPSVFVKVRF